MVVMLASSIQRAETWSNSISFWESVVMAAMYFPSGDQRGEKRFSAPGKSETFSVFKSRMEIPRAVIPALCIDRTMDSPSEDQDGSNPASDPGIKSRGVPPLGETRYARQLVLIFRPMNTICFPSGDQRGRAAHITDVLVNWSRSLPSTLLRQRAWSGTEI
jgi:hypothetical protein